MIVQILIATYIVTTIAAFWFAKTQMVLEPISYYSKLQNILRKTRKMAGIILFGWLLSMLFIIIIIIVMIAGTIDKIFNLEIINY